jgi:hypothetical protein
MTLGTKVFVIHGRDKRARREFFAFLRAIGLSPIEWTQALAEAGGGAPTIGDILDKAIRPGRAFVVLLTPDDVAHLKPEHRDGDGDPDVRPSGQARPNVLFEAGMAMGRHPENTVLVQFGEIRPFTDVAGRFVVRLDGSADSRHKLANRLRSIGCEVDMNGSDWLSAGDLTPPTSEPAATTVPVPSVPRRAGAAQALDTDSTEFTSSQGTRDVELANLSRRRSGGRLIIDGEVTNHETNALMLALKATLYDSAGRILGSANGLVTEIGSGERKAFELETYDKIKEFAKVHVQVDTAMEL